MNALVEMLECKSMFYVYSAIIQKRTKGGGEIRKIGGGVEVFQTMKDN